VDYLNSVDHLALIWRVKSGTYNFPWIAKFKVHPTSLLRGGQVGAVVYYPPGNVLFEWELGNAKVLTWTPYGVGWTKDNDKFIGGYFGEAGRRIIYNAVKH
jgi:hypothetical protein